MSLRIRFPSKIFDSYFVWSDIKKAFVSFVKDQCPWDLLLSRTLKVDTLKDSLSMGGE